MQRLILIKPSLTHKNEILNYQQAYRATNLVLHGANQLAQFSAETFADWLDYLHAPAGTHLFGYDKVSDSTYLAWHKNENRMIGIINIRHELNQHLLKYGGHIGYSIHPQEWGKGYATEMLALALEKTDALGIKRVMLSCDKNNIASSKVIMKNNGILENEVHLENKVIQHYWIKRY
ncbi:MAG: GNAT family N-acetyltransferase [Pasteurella oralis]|uniref:GNAT family N-acetyltransferase n=1 Tax=Pasteurella oralis TaxID=1071947 RepID=UPI000C7C832B|nr:GNAT family N-acetyltransferase [Pasteurella oralis]MDO5054501.1 GNAT family N-acetyltransferase [Pasteurella oralis]